MAINYTEYTLQEYVDAVVELISRVEGFRSQVYKLDDGEVTIGCGYTFGRSNNVALWTAAGITITPAELQVLQRIDNASTKEEKNRIAFSEFTRPITADEARALLKQTYPQYEGPANDINMPLSPERVAFVAVTYNRGARRVRETMRDFYQAIRDGDRAEAWFQIRYKSLGKEDQYINGKAKARYLESQVFGLYDDSDNVTAEEAISVFKMLHRHRKEIYDHEARFGQKFDGSDGTRNMISEGNNDTNYRLVLGHFEMERIDTINQALDSGKTTLLADLRTRYQDSPEIVNSLQDNSIVSTNIYLNPAKPTDADQSSTLDARPYETGNYANGANDLMVGMDQRDLMHGGKGNDILLGEGGRDSLFGEEGDDILAGGAGDDVYFYHAGDGNDRIIDNQGNNTIVVIDANGDIRVIGNVYRDGTTNVWTTADGKVQFTHNSPWKVVLEDGSTIELGDNFQDGDFGIHLLNVPDSPQTNIIGDLTPIDFDPTIEGVQTETDGLDNVIVDPRNPYPNRNDMLYDSAGNDGISFLITSIKNCRCQI